jgi:exosome complex RNA-binding protein Rrp42 (RNase PH superfamily)
MGTFDGNGRVPEHLGGATVVDPVINGVGRQYIVTLSLNGTELTPVIDYRLIDSGNTDVRAQLVDRVLKASDVVSVNGLCTTNGNFVVPLSFY